jgi:hypothetical protein
MTDRTRDFPDLESPISDLSMMVGVTCTIMESFSTGLEASRDLTDVSVGAVVKSIECEFEELMFCVYHLNSMTKALSRLYFAEPGAAA